MKTSKPFATISYNTAPFLQRKLEDLILSRKIEFYTFVHHFKEEDELKEHKHLYIVPNGLIDTDSVVTYLVEPDTANPLNKPLGCIRCKPSKFADWYLYGKHDEDYLASKGQSRKYHYSLEDFISSDNDYMLEEVHTIDYSSLNRSKALKEAVNDGIEFSSLVAQGLIPIQQVYAYQQTYNILMQNKFNELERNGRLTHTPIEDSTENI